MTPLTLAAVDPGITATGLALFRNQRLFCTMTFQSELPPTAHWAARAENVAMQALHAIPAGSILAIELPIVYQSEAGVNAQRSGTIVKLALQAGMIYMGYRCRPDSHMVKAVTAPEWKGQLPHEIVVKRVLRAYPRLATANPSEHEIDAVGLGMFCLKGVFK